MNFYQCKFDRERKNHPTHWMIVNTGSGCKLIHIGHNVRSIFSAPQRMTHAGTTPRDLNSRG